MNVITKEEVPTPLVVDVDGTLAASDLLHEAALQFLAQHPLRIWQLPLWLRRGKSELKTRLADEIDPGIDTMPLRHKVMALIHQVQKEGRPVYLASASDARYVTALAARIGGIAGVFATDGRVNLAGSVKAKRLTEAFGAGGFDYVGDQPVDFPVWQSARRVLVVAHSRGFANRVRQKFPAAEIIVETRLNLPGVVRALRPHQWAKNLLVFLPMCAAHRFDYNAITASIYAFVCFSFAASSAYVANDLLDLPGDRDHPRKRKRPFASATLSITAGIILSAVMLAGSCALSLLLTPAFVGILLLYIGTTLAYSFVLKRKVLIDVVVLSGLYTIRVLGGLAATNIEQTKWILMFSLFLFLSLAIVKRCSELVLMRAEGVTALKGRAYRAGDLAALMPLGAAAGYGAVFVAALYMSSPEVQALYHRPANMWLLCPLLVYWISRVLLISNRGEMHDDPLVFAVSDRMSWITAAAMAIVVLIST